MALASRRDHCLQCLGFVGSQVVGDPFGVSMVSVLSHDRDWDDLGAPQRLRKHLNIASIAVPKSSFQSESPVTMR
jgi:hypothetical protein